MSLGRQPGGCFIARTPLTPNWIARPWPRPVWHGRLVNGLASLPTVRARPRPRRTLTPTTHPHPHNAALPLAEAWPARWLHSAAATARHARVLDGRAVAAAWQEELAHDVRDVYAKGGRPPGLGVVLVGARPDSLLYVTRKREACERVCHPAAKPRLCERPLCCAVPRLGGRRVSR